MSLKYSGGLISARMVLKVLTSENCRVAGSRRRTSVVIVGAYYFVRSTGRRDVRGVLRVTRCGGGNDTGTLVIAKYVTRHCHRRVLSRVPRMSRILKAATCSHVLSTMSTTLTKRRRIVATSLSTLPLPRAGHLMAAKKRFTCLGVTRKYSGRYACYVVPGVHKGFEDMPVRHLLGRTRSLTRRNMGRLVLITRRAALCKGSLCKRGSLPGLLHRLYGVDKVH